MIRKTAASPFVIILLLFGLISQVFPQKLSRDEREVVRRINEADGYFIYDEDYYKASMIYRQLLSEDPGNHNLSYKLGVCYLNIRGSEPYSLDLLRYAASNYVEDFEYSTIGREAPFDVLYYLAYSCQVNMHLQEAIDNYMRYENLLRVREASEIEFINKQVKACRNTLEAMTKGTILKRRLLAPWFSEMGNCTNAVISANDSVLVFTCSNNGRNTVYTSRREADSWGRPGDITSDLGGYSDMTTNSLDGRGRRMIISRNDGVRGNLYISLWDGEKWGRLEKLNKNINTRYWEAHGSLTPDGRRLYFSSNRPGGYGSLDIYMADSDDGVNFGIPSNIGPVINTRFEENTPYYDTTTKSLYFSSTGHEGFGGYDIFVSGHGYRWSTPAHLPFPLNTTSDDLNYIPYGDANNGLYAGFPNDTSKASTIYLVTHGISAFRETILAEGEVTLGDGMIIIPDSMRVLFFSGLPENPVDTVECSSEGEFLYEMALNRYTVTISYPGYVSDTFDINMPESYASGSLQLSRTLVPESVHRGEFLSVRNILFEFDSFTLSREAMIEIEKIVPALLRHDDLIVEVEGFADPIGSSSYNMRLSEKRAESVYRYLVNSGISESRMVHMGAGESGFIALNRNPDGSDNPEGRMYNRRASISVRNNGYQVSLESQTFVPFHLRRQQSVPWYVVVKESPARLSPGYFSGHQLSEFSLVREAVSDGIYRYFVGEFLTRTDAINFLAAIRGSGFSDSYIASGYELGEDDEPVESGVTLYTIQLHALKNRATLPFPGLKNVREVKGADGFWRYIAGEYRGYSKAAEALRIIRSKGYPQAYIKEFTMLEQQTIKE